MTDLEITKLCAQAMGYEPMAHGDNVFYEDAYGHTRDYLPIHDDAQAMALVKKFKPWIIMFPDSGAPDVKEITVTICKRRDEKDGWLVHHPTDLNRAICECVAKMQQSKHDR